MLTADEAGNRAAAAARHRWAIANATDSTPGTVLIAFYQRVKNSRRFSAV